MKNSCARGFRRLSARGRFAPVALLSIVSAAPLLLASTAKAATIVACIGEQTTTTTEGATAVQLWPGQLGVLLGNTYQVDNDVMNNGNTVTSGNCVTAASKNPIPAIVVIGPFAEHDYAAGVTEQQWQASYAAVVKQYLDLVPSPDVYVMTPPPGTFAYQSAAEQTFATDVVKPAVLAVAAANPAKVHVVDLFSDTKLVPGAGDGHFTIPQYVEVATLAYNAIKGGGAGGGGAGGAGGSGGAAGSSGAAAGGTAGSSGAATGGTGGAGGSAGTATTGGVATGGVSAGGVSAGGVSTGGVAMGGVTSGGAGTTLAGTGGTGTLPTAGTTAAGTGTAAPTSAASSSDSGGCSFQGSGSKAASASWLVLLGALLVQRRRRRA